MELSKKVMKTGGDIYSDPLFSGTILSKSITTTAEAETAVTALEAISWSNL
jgi:hypothetical protein